MACCTAFASRRWGNWHLFPSSATKSNSVLRSDNLLHERWHKALPPVEPCSGERHDPVGANLAGKWHGRRLLDRCSDAQSCTARRAIKACFGRKRTVSAVAVRDLTWPSTLFKRHSADPVRTPFSTDHPRTRPSGRESPDDPNRRAVQRERTPSVATEGVRS